MNGRPGGEPCALRGATYFLYLGALPGQVRHFTISLKSLRVLRPGPEGAILLNLASRKGGLLTMLLYVNPPKHLRVSGSKV